MTDDELKDLSKQLVEAVANRCHHIIHDDDPIMTVAVLLQVIASNLSAQQKRLLEDSAKSVLSGALQVQLGFEKTTGIMLENMRALLAREIQDQVGLAMTCGKQTLQDLLRAESCKALAAQRAQNSTVGRIKQAAQIALAASVLSFLGGLAVLFAVAAR